MAETFFILKQFFMHIVHEILQDIWHTNNAIVPPGLTIMPMYRVEHDALIAL